MARPGSRAAVSATGGVTIGCCLAVLVVWALQIWLAIVLLADLLTDHPAHKAVDIVVLAIIVISWLGGIVSRGRR